MMPNVNARADVTTRVRNDATRTDTRQDTAGQAVETRHRAADNQVPVEQVTQAAQETRATSTTQVPTASRTAVPDVGVSYVMQSAAPSAAAQQVTAQAETVAPRHMSAQAVQAAQTSGFAEPMAAERTVAQGRSVPVLDASQVGELQPASRRRNMRTDAYEAALGAQGELDAARRAGTGLDVLNPVPSSRTERTQERDARRHAEREQVMRDEIIGSVVANGQAQTAQSTQVAQSGTGRPDTDMNRPVGWQQRDRTPRLREPSRRRPKSVRDAEKKRAATALNREGVGNHVYGKVIGNRRLSFRDVGVGAAEIYAACQQDPTMMARLFSEYSDDVPDLSSLLVTELADFVNSHDIWVATFKPPDNRSQDAQSRRLRVMTDQMRGIYLHPVMAAMYTADFDGDDMSVSFDPDTESVVLDPMRQLVDVFGDQTLNTDFLPVTTFADGWAEGKTARDFVREVVLSTVSGVDGRTLSPLVDAILDLCDTSNGIGSASVAWGDVFREARAVADSMAGRSLDRSDRIMEGIVERIYHIMHDVLMARTLDAGRVVRPEGIPEAVSYSDFALYAVLDGMVEGEAPNNFQDLKVALTGYLGDVEGKNAPFRFTGDVGKVAKMDSRLQVGNGDFVVDPNDDGQMRTLFETTMKFAESYRMAVGYKKAGHSTYYTQVLRERVLSEVGMPEAYESYTDFIERFVESYRTASSIINQANMTMLTSGGISSDSDAVSTISDMTASGIAQPLLSVYGLNSVGRMFPHLAESGIMTEDVDPRWKGKPGHVTNLTRRGGDASKAYEREWESSRSEFWVTNRYSQWSLRKFAHESRMARGYSDVDLSRIYEMDDAHAELAIMLAIADKGTGAASKFNQSTYGREVRHRDGKVTMDYDGTSVGMMAELLRDVARGVTSERMLFVNDDIDTLIASSPDLFHHFDMDSPAGFLASDWGKALLAARDNPDLIGGIRLAMVAEWRMERIAALESDMPTDDMRKWMTAQNNLSLAKDELADTSEAWGGIIRELEAHDSAGMRSVFQMMRESGRATKTSVSGEEYVWETTNDSTWYASRFWSDMGGHEDLRSVLSDRTMGYKEKCDIIADVVRYWENDMYLASHEVGFQMEIGNDTSYSMAGGGRKSVLKTFRDFEQAFNRWGNKSEQALRSDVERASKRWRGRPGMLMRTITALAQHREAHVSVSDDVYADALMSVLDKTYAQTEKAKQQPWTNRLYSALSYQLNGGFMNDVERTNDRLLGIQSASSVSVSDLLRVLSDPNESVEVYDEYGAVSEPITRNTLIRELLGREPSTDVESDLWDLLTQNPRLASALRIHSVCSIANMDGTAFVGAGRSLDETMELMSQWRPSPVDRTKFLLRDHPGYAAIISLSMPLRGAETRTQRGRAMQAETWLAWHIAQAATMDCDATEAARSILADMGITQEGLRETMASDFDRFYEELGLPVMRESVDETDEDADNIWTNALSNLSKYIEEVRSDLPQGIRLGNAPLVPTFGPDVSSLASYWDVTQELGGAKTAVSTGIEGAETYRWAFWASRIRPTDRFADVLNVSDDIDRRWDGMWTSRGRLSVDESGNATVDGTPVSELEAGVVCEVPEGYQVKDLSTDSRGTQVPSVLAYMVSKRSNGAEAFNLKAKKAGHDAADSITKMSGRLKANDDGTLASFADSRDILMQTYRRTGDIRDAQMQLAQMIMDENVMLGYKDLRLQNYMCVAELMLRDDGEGGIVLRTLPMLFDAIKGRIGASVDGMTNEEITKAAQTIVDDVSETGVGRMVLDPMMVFDGLRVSSKSTTHDGIRPQSSSFERNYDLLASIEREAMRDGVLADNPMTVDTNDGGVRNVINRSSSLRNYDLVGFTGGYANDGVINWAVGPRNLVVIGDGTIGQFGARLDAVEVADILDRAYRYGMTVLVGAAHLDMIPERYAADAVPCSRHGDAMLSMFDIRLNGSEATGYNGGRFAMFQVDPSRYVLSVEDPMNYFELGDAQYKPTRHFTDRIRNIETGSAQVSADDLFPNVFGNPDFAHCSLSVSLASGSTLARLIARGVRCTIDYGMVPSDSREWRQRVHDVDAAIVRYQQRWQDADYDGIMRTDGLEPGDIVAWAECGIHDELTGGDSYVLAPIIPFPLHGSQRGPETYSTEQVDTVDNDNTLFSISWRNQSSVADSNAKYFDSSGGANKGMIDFVDSIDLVGGRDLVMRDGTAVDNYVAKASTDSRKVGTDRRVKTMISLMTLARLHGYNFAEVDGSFPDDPGLRDRLKSERIPRADWVRMMRDGVRFSVDSRMDAFLRFECQKVLDNGGNPSDYLAEQYTDSDGSVRHTRLMWEFEAMFERGMEYENQLLRFLHSMDPTFCPDGFDDTSECLFRLKPEAKGFDRGVLEMEAPYPTSDGNVSYLWANAYIGMSFFGEDFSGFSRPNVSGASNFMDAMNTYSYYGAQLDDKSAGHMAAWATSDIGRLPDGGAIGRA